MKKPRLKFLKDIIRVLRVYRSYKKNIKEHKPNIVHLNSACSKYGIIKDYFFIKYAKKKNIEVIIHYHCNILDQISNKNKLSLNYLKRTCKLVDHNLVLNQTSYETISKFTNNISIMPNFIEYKKFANENISISSNIKNVIFTGRVTKQKGIYEIIELATKTPNYNYLIYGPISVDFEIKNIPTNISLMGEYEICELSMILKKGDVFLLPSYTEGFSISILEAMAVGLPIITTNVGANKEMIQNKGGYVLSTLNINDFYNAILSLEDCNIRKNMSKWNKQKVEDYYDINVILNKVKKLYYKIINNQKN